MAPNDGETLEPLAGFPVVVRIPVQWGDQDAFGHVNNIVFFRWFESARIDYMRHVFQELPKSDAASLILASIQCDFRRPVEFPDTVHVGGRVTRIGRSSLTMEHAIFSESQAAVVAEGTSTIVMFDYEANASRPVPDQVRARIAALEGREF